MRPALFLTSRPQSSKNQHRNMLLIMTHHSEASRVVRICSAVIHYRCTCDRGSMLDQLSTIESPTYWSRRLVEFDPKD